MLLALSACRVDGDVLIQVEDDGSGVVTASAVLDAEAAKFLGDVETSVRLADLKSAGWKVHDPRVDKTSGDVILRATHSFGSPNALAGLLEDIGGEAAHSDAEAAPTTQSGIFSDVLLEVDDGFARTRYKFSADLDLSGSVEQFSDPALTEALGGLPLGRTPEELEVSGVSASDAASLRMRVELPGSLVSTNGGSNGDQVSWKYDLNSGEATATTIAAESEDKQRSAVLILGAGGGVILLAIGLVVVGVVRRQR